MITVTSNTGFDRAKDTYKSTAHLLMFEAEGLLLNTQYNVKFDDVDYGFASKPWGGKLGDPLISDGSGYLKFYILVESRFNDAGTHLTGVTNEVSTKVSAKNLYRTNKTIILQTPNGASKITASVPSNCFLIPSVTNQIDEGL